MARHLGQVDAAYSVISDIPEPSAQHLHEQLQKDCPNFLVRGSQGRPLHYNKSLIQRLQETLRDYERLEFFVSGSNNLNLDNNNFNINNNNNASNNKTTLNFSNAAKIGEKSGISVIDDFSSDVTNTGATTELVTNAEDEISMKSSIKNPFSDEHQVNLNAALEEQIYNDMSNVPNHHDDEIKINIESPPDNLLTSDDPINDHTDKQSENGYTHNSDSENSSSEFGDFGEASEFEVGNSGKNEKSHSNKNEEQITTDEDEVSQEKKKKDKYYPFHVGEVTFCTARVAISKKEMSAELLKQVIKQYIRTDLHCYCPLTFDGGFRENRYNAVGYGQCHVSSHGAKYKFEIIEKDGNFIQLDVSCNTDYKFTHKPSDKSVTQIRGEKRKKILKLLKYRPTKQVYLENCRQSYQEHEQTNYTDNDVKLHVFEKIKSDDHVANREKLQSLDLGDCLQQWVTENLLKDKFVRMFKVPFCVILFEQRQLQVINPNVPAIVHLDSTGANVKVPAALNCRTLYYYSLVYRASKSTVPLNQMITSEQDITTISEFLRLHADTVKEYFKGWPFKGVVVDWSWPSMHSILNVYNNSTIEKYVQETYDYYDKGIKPKRNTTFLLSCCGHIMHRLSIRIEELDLEKIKVFLMNCMGQLILCRNKKELDNKFKIIATILLAKKQETAQHYIKELQELLEDEDHILTELLKETDEYILNKSNVTYVNDLFRIKSSNAIYSNSPFYIRFLGFIREILELLSELEAGVQEVTNLFYSPEYLYYILEKYLAYTSICFALLLDLVDENISRVSNAYVECHNKIYKDQIQEGRKDKTVGDTIRALKNYNDCLIAEEKLFQLRADDGGVTIIKYPPTKEKAADPKTKDAWARSKKDLEKVKPKKERNSYMSGRNIIKISEKVVENSSQAECTEAEDKVLKKSSTRKINRDNNDEKQPKRTKHNTETFVGKNAFEFLNNGLINSSTYYMKSNSPSVKFALYSAHVDIFFYQKEFTLSPYQLHSLYDLHGWVDGQVIDSFASCITKQKRALTYIPTDLTDDAIGQASMVESNYRLLLGKHNQEISDTLVMPYRYNKHWFLLIVNINLEQLTLLDPYGGSTDVNRVQSSFIKFIEKCTVTSPFRKLKNKNWTITTGDEKRPMQNDCYSCGVFCMYYIERFYNNLPMDNDQFNPDEFRASIFRELLVGSDNMGNRCLFCANKISDEREALKCNICNRFMHRETCISNDGNSSDVETRFTKPRSKTKKEKNIEKIQIYLYLFADYVVNQTDNLKA